MSLKSYESLRKTGKSTRSALWAIQESIDSPGKWIKIVDHHSTHAADKHLMDLVYDIINKLGLIEFEFDVKNSRFRSNYYGIVLNRDNYSTRKAKKEDYEEDYE